VSPSPPPPPGAGPPRGRGGPRGKARWGPAGPPRPPGGGRPGGGGGDGDTTYNNPDDTLINATTNRWAHLAYTYDGNESRVFIDGLLVNTNDHNDLVTHEFLSDGTTPLTFGLGAENDGGNLTSTPVAFSGTIGRVRVDDTALSDSDILNQFNSEKAFFSGVPEPSSAVLSGFAAFLLMTRRRRS